MTHKYHVLEKHLFFTSAINGYTVQARTKLSLYLAVIPRLTYQDRHSRLNSSSAPAPVSSCCLLLPSSRSTGPCLLRAQEPWRWSFCDKKAWLCLCSLALALLPIPPEITAGVDLDLECIICVRTNKKSMDSCCAWCPGFADDSLLALIALSLVSVQDLPDNLRWHKNSYRVARGAILDTGI